jgi:hypothetical protein
MASLAGACAHGGGLSTLASAAHDRSQTAGLRIALATSLGIAHDDDTLRPDRTYRYADREGRSRFLFGIKDVVRPLEKALWKLE